MIVFLTYFMLLSDQLFKRKLVEIVGTLSQKKLTVSVLEDIAGQIERFLVIQILTSAAVAVVTWGALWALGLQQAALWGLAAGILNSIPYYGPLLITAGLSIVGYLQFGTLGMTAAVAGCGPLDHHARGMVPDAVAHRTRRVDEPRGDLCRTAVLELGLGRLGHAARRTDNDGDQGGLRSRGRASPSGAPAG